MFIPNVPKRNYLKFHVQKVEIIKFLMAMVCELEKVGTVCKLCFMLMRDFGRIGVEWRNLTMDSVSSTFGTEFR